MNHTRNLSAIAKILETDVKKMSRAEMNKRANAILRSKFEMMIPILECENCGSIGFLTFAHKKKRRHYKNMYELSDLNEVILLCIHCHEIIEKSPSLTLELFAKLRGKNWRKKYE